MFALRWDARQCIADLEALKSGGAAKAIARGINRTAASEKVALSREVAKDMGLAVGVAKDAISIEQARPTRLSARVIGKGSRIPLVDFKARGPEPSRGRGRGVTARLPGGKGRYPSAFIATMKSGHRGVFQRVPNADRTPMFELFGPSIGKVFEKVVPVGEARRAEVLNKNVQRELEFALSRAKG